MSKSNGFFAYPSVSTQFSNTIKMAIRLINTGSKFSLHGWEENDIAGKHLLSTIFEKINNSEILIADITKLNFNVTYEIGYAIGIGIRIFLVKNDEFSSESEKIKKIGIFDTLGYKTYSNSNELANLIKGVTDLNPINIVANKNKSAPVFILETPKHSEIMSQIVSRVKKTRLFYRSYTPSEESRMSAIDTIRHIVSSFGTIVPLLNSNLADADIHNIRAAFVAGLSIGIDIPTLILQDKDGPLSPIDVRDFVKEYLHPDDIINPIHEFSLKVIENLQKTSDIELPEGNFLSKILIGDPMAENEFQELSNYYLQTDEYGRTVRGEVNLVVGRKGTGKTALFSQVRNIIRSNRSNIVIDLKPEGYQLIKLKEQVLDFLSAGSKAHLITAFWEYLLYLEVCYKILEKDQVIHLRNHTLTDGYQKLASLYYDNPFFSQGDFSERLLTLSKLISETYQSKFGKADGTRLMADDITNIVHSQHIKKLRDHLSDYLMHKNEVWILFDNLDKGWNTQSLASGDIIILRCLIDAARKIQRDMIKNKHEFHTIVFIRNDVYQLLMKESADFGKESRATLDWSDSDLLREMLRRRLVKNDLPTDTKFEDIWTRICVSLFEGEETSQYFIDRSLMRPRNLIKIVGACRGFAVNLQHEKIEETDIEKGLMAYSNDLIVDAIQELTDIEPETENILYKFIGGSCRYNVEDLNKILGNVDKQDKIIEFLLYYGILGIKIENKETKYIFDYGYNLEIMFGLITKFNASFVYEINPAFWPGLELSN